MDSEQKILLEDYKLRVQYLVDQYTRMWNRFNYFLTLHTAISAGLFTLLASEKNDLKAFTITIAVMGFIFAVFWYIFAAQDKYLVELYRKQVSYVQNQIEALKELPSIVLVKEPAEFFENMKLKIKFKPYQWRKEIISTTKLAAWFPIVIIAYWLVLIFLVNLYV